MQSIDKNKLSNLETALSVKSFSLSYGGAAALKDINVDIPKQHVTAFIGPSGCGKSTLLRSFNRMNDLISDVQISGTIQLNGRDIYHPSVEVAGLRRQIGMVFQRPNPFPKTIYENVAFGLKIQGENAKSVLDETVEWALRNAALWEEVKDRLDESALSLSGGQQQRLVIARAIAIKPSVLLLDEPASALDPISTLKIEELIHQLKEQYTIVIVTHNMQQAARVSDFTAFLNLGELIEYGDTDSIFRYPPRKAHRGLHHRPIWLKWRYEPSYLRTVRHRIKRHPRAADGNGRLGRATGRGCLHRLCYP